MTGCQIRFMAAPPPIQSLNLNLVPGLSLAMELTRFGTNRPASPCDRETEFKRLKHGAKMSLKIARSGPERLYDIKSATILLR